MTFYYGNTIHLLFSLRSFRKHRKSSSTLNVQLKSVAKILFSVILFFPPIQKVILSNSNPEVESQNEHIDLNYFESVLLWHQKLRKWVRDMINWGHFQNWWSMLYLIISNSHILFQQYCHREIKNASRNYANISQIPKQVAHCNLQCSTNSLICRT